MYLGTHAHDSIRNASTHYNRSPREPIFNFFLIWMTTSRHRGLFFVVVLNIHKSQTIFTAPTFCIKGQSSCSLCATHFSFSVFGFTLFMVHFVYKLLKGMGCGFTVAKSEQTKVLWPFLDCTHLTCIHSQLEMVCRKFDLITYNFHSSHLFTRETCNFASWTIKTALQDAILIPFTPNTTWFLEDAYTWDLL